MRPTPDLGRAVRRGLLIFVVVLVVGASLSASGARDRGTRMVPPGLAGPTARPHQPNFGPYVYLFGPNMPQSRIQATVNSIAREQVHNQFGTQRYALLFEPGSYGSAADPLYLEVGYYTSVSGLGSLPGDVVING